MIHELPVVSKLVHLQSEFSRQVFTLALENVAWHSLQEIGDRCGDALLFSCEVEGTTLALAKGWGGGWLRQASCRRTNGKGGNRNRALQHQGGCPSLVYRELSSS